MKVTFRIFIFLFLLNQITISAQEIPFDSIIKKARLQIYDNPEHSISTAKKLLKNEKNIDRQIKIYMLFSTANIAKRNFDQSLQYILKAKELSQKSNDLKTQTSVLISLAIQYQQMELFSKSFETLNEVDKYLAKLPDNLNEKYIETARAYAIRGMIYKSQSNPEIALEKFLKSVENFEKVSPKKPTYSNLSVVFYNIGYCHLHLSQIEKAEETFWKSVNYAKKNNAKSLEAFALKGIAEVFKQKRRNKEALNLLLQAQELCKNTNDLILNEGIYKEMSENYLAIGNQNQYQNYNKKYFEMHFQREQNELNSINYIINNHNTENLKKRQNIKTRYFKLSILVIGLETVIFISILYFILKIRRQNRKYRNEIQNLIKS